MIRPATCLTMLLAAASGLYLYQAKHQAYVLDRQIDAVLQDTGKIHAHIAVLRAEYALMNDPSRLQQLAGAYLPALVPPTPTQFTTLSELGSRLPAVTRPNTPPAEPVAAPPPPEIASAKMPPVPMAEPAAAAPIAESAAAVVADAPAPAVPAVVASLAAPVSPAASAIVDAEVQGTPHPAPPPRRAVRVVAAAKPRRAVVAPRPDPLSIEAAAAPLPSAPPQGGSVLGMARSMPVPAYATYQRYRPGGSETLAP